MNLQRFLHKLANGFTEEQEREVEAEMDRLMSEKEKEP